MPGSNSWSAQRAPSSNVQDLQQAYPALHDPGLEKQRQDIIDQIQRMRDMRQQQMIEDGLDHLDDQMGIKKKPPQIMLAGSPWSAQRTTA